MEGSKNKRLEAYRVRAILAAGSLERFAETNDAVL